MSSMARLQRPSAALTANATTCNSLLTSNPCHIRPFVASTHLHSPSKHLNTHIHTRLLVQTSVSLKIKDYGGLGDFDLTDEQQSTLEAYLNHPAYLEQIWNNYVATSGRSDQEQQVSLGSSDDQAAAAKIGFTGLIFQPVPWSENTRKGMPKEMEQYADSPEHIIVYVHPKIMFQAKIFNPSRLCAIYSIKNS